MLFIITDLAHSFHGLREQSALSVFENNQQDSSGIPRVQVAEQKKGGAALPPHLWLMVYTFN
jgi:hypothetical protein